MEKYKQLVEMIQLFEKDFEKFYVRQNKTAGIRVRKHMQEVRKLAQEIRMEVQDLKNAM